MPLIDGTKIVSVRTRAGTTRRAGNFAVKRLPVPGVLSISRVAWCRARACLTNGEPQARAARFARAAAVDR